MSKRKTTLGSSSKPRYNAGSGSTGSNPGFGGSGPGQTVYGQGNVGSAPGYASPQAQPLDWQSQMALTAANRNVSLSNAQATYDTGRIQRDFGYNAQGGIDPSNPYSRAALLEQNYKQHQAGDLNSSAAQGNLYAGSYQNQINETARQHSQGVNQLQNQYSDALGGVKLNQLGTYANSGAGLSDEQFQALLRQLGGK